MLYAEKDFNLPKHPEIDVPNLEVIKLMQSFKSKEYVTERYAWRHYYWCGGRGAPIVGVGGARAVGSFVPTGVCCCCCVCVCVCGDERSGAACCWLRTCSAPSSARLHPHVCAWVGDQSLPPPALRHRRPAGGGAGSGHDIATLCQAQQPPCLRR